MAGSTLQARPRRPGNAPAESANALFSLRVGVLPPPLKRSIVTSGAHDKNKQSPLSTCLLAGMTVKEFLVPAARRSAKSAAFAAVAVLALGFAGPAFAQQPPAASASLSQNPTQSRGATRYNDLGSDRSFVLEERGREALLQVEGSSEVMILEVVRGQRGDTFLKSESGQVMIRKTEAGNMVSFIGSKNGAPADAAGRVGSLDAPPLPESLNDIRVKSASRLSKMAGHDVTIFGTPEFSNDEQWAADALANVEIGVQRANGLAGKVAAKLNAVRLVRTKAASVTFKDGELVLGINPVEGYAGRVSSEAITNVLTASRNAG